MKEQEKRKSLRILVFAPHPDDDLIGCGGSIAKHLKNGSEVFVVYVTNGDADCPEYVQDQFTLIRKEETENAALVIGLKPKNLFFLDEYPWKLNRQEIRLKLLKLVREIKPHVCYIPHFEDNHVDHRIVSQVALDAINMAPDKWFSRERHTFSKSPIILAYEVWTPLTDPNYFKDITDVIENKMEALREHKTQNTKAYERAHRGLNAFRGAMHEGKDNSYAEAFQILKISDLFH